MNQEIRNILAKYTNASPILEQLLHTSDPITFIKDAMMSDESKDEFIKLKNKITNAYEQFVLISFFMRLSYDEPALYAKLLKYFT